MRATSRPEGYFLHLADDTRVLGWWANIFVAAGLTFTFLGIVAALTVAVESLEAVGSGNINQPLIKLLQMTSVKFWTSIAGVSSSIILRAFDRSWHARTQQALEIICDRLERGTLFSPPQRIAAEQLRELKQQSVALSEFSTKLAVGIGDALERQMQPMISVLGGIQTSIDDFKSGSFNQIGKELGEALSKNAGAEMQQLASALTDMTGNLSSIHQKLDESGKAANDQIASAARDFALASEQMKTAFGGLNDQIGGMGAKLTSEAEGVADRNAVLLAAAAEALEKATSRTSETMGRAIDDALSQASKKSAETMEGAFAEFGKRFGDAGSELVETISTATTQMEKIAASIERSTTAADRHANKLIDAGTAAEGISTALSSAASEFKAATSPIREATASVNTAVTRVQELLAAHGEVTGRQSQAMSEISDKLGETAEAATKAWREYRSRFEDVDKALAAALDKIKDASGEHASALNEQTGRIDKALADAVDRLKSALDPLSDLAESMEDLIGRLRDRA